MTVEEFQKFLIEYQRVSAAPECCSRCIITRLEI